MPEERSLPQVVEAYKDYSPPPQVLRIVRLLLRYVPPEHLIGLKTVVLTNRAALSHDKRRQKLRSRGRKAGMRRVLGSYHQAWKGNPAWIDLYVDLIVSYYGFPLLFHLPILRYIPFSGVLYHEIGHHIHKTSRPEFREPEDVAEKWRDKLGTRFVWKRYWYLVPLFGPMRVAIRLFERARKSPQDVHRRPVRNR